MKLGTNIHHESGHPALLRFSRSEVKGQSHSEAKCTFWLRDSHRLYGRPSVTCISRDAISLYLVEIFQCKYSSCGWATQRFSGSEVIDQGQNQTKLTYDGGANILTAWPGVIDLVMCNTWKTSAERNRHRTGLPLRGELQVDSATVVEIRSGHDIV